MIMPSEALFNDYKNKNNIMNEIMHLQLSSRTITRGIEEIEENLENQPKKDLNLCSFYSTRWINRCTKYLTISHNCENGV